MNNRQNYYIEQEVQNVAKTLLKTINAFDEVLLINSDQEEAELLIEQLASFESTSFSVTLFDYKDEGKESRKQRKVSTVFSQEKWRNLQLTMLDTEQKLIILFNNRCLDQRQVKAQLEAVKAIMMTNERNQFIMVSESYVESLKTNYYIQYSEQEYALNLSSFPEGSPEKLSSDNDKYCTMMYEEGINTCILNYVNLFGPTIGMKHRNPVSKLCHSVACDRKVEYEPTDKASVNSYTYIGDLYNVIAGLISAERLRYSRLNISSYTSDLYSIKVQIQAGFPGYPVTVVSAYAEDHKSYALLQPMKVRKISKHFKAPAVRVALEHTILSEFSNREIDDLVVDRYNEKFKGKIDKIRELELGILRDIHRICEKYNLHYVLTAGTMLGAVRHRGFIPWDDDADIGMSREDFEIFRRVAPRELNERYYYQNSTNPDDSHYVLDKIRLKGTSLSTRWTSMFDYPDGIYVDIYVYDKTSNNRVLQKVHVKLLKLVYQAITLRWVNKARKHKKYVASLLVLPILRLFSNNFLYKIYNAALQIFSYSKHSRFVIDGVGGNLRKGGIPSDWLFSGRKLMRFEDADFYVPQQYEKFLTSWYGEDFMELLPISKRSTHNYVDIDLGKYMQT